MTTTFVSKWFWIVTIIDSITTLDQAKACNTLINKLTVNDVLISSNPLSLMTYRYKQIKSLHNHLDSKIKSLTNESNREKSA